MKTSVPAGSICSVPFGPCHAPVSLLPVVLGAAAVMNIVGHFVGGEIAGMPMNLVLQYGVPLFMVPVLMAFKYGKPRGYVRDLAFWHTKPRAYCAMARDREIRTAYLREE